MSQHDSQAQQGSSTVKSFALQFDSDSEAGSVVSNGIDSPPQERRAEERDKDSARRATLAALGLVPGPPPPVSGTPTKPNSGTMTPRNNVSSPQISPSASFEAFPDQSAMRKAQGLDSPPGGMARNLQGPSQAVPPAQSSSASRSGFGVSPFSKVSENIAGLTKPASLKSPESSKVKCRERLIAILYLYADMQELPLYRASIHQRLADVSFFADLLSVNCSGATQYDEQWRASAARGADRGFQVSMGTLALCLLCMIPALCTACFLLARGQQTIKIFFAYLLYEGLVYTTGSQKALKRSP